MAFCTISMIRRFAWCGTRSFTSAGVTPLDRKSTRLNSSHSQISYAVFCLKKKTKHEENRFTKALQPRHRAGVLVPISGGAIAFQLELSLVRRLLRTLSPDTTPYTSPDRA